MVDNETEKGIRLQLYMAKSGVASRRKSEELISEGRVKVNGKTVTAMGFLVKDEVVSCDGKVIRPVKKHVYFMLNKPSGYLCSNKDDQGRPLAVNLLKGAYSGRLFNVGRLDFLSSGLIFFTNDGDFTKKVSHPSARIEKEYLVETKEDIPESFLQACKKGIVVEGIKYKIEQYTYKGANKVHLVLVEGKNREIRNLFMAQRMKIKKLHRIRIGAVSAKGLPTGQYRPLSQKEINLLLGSSGKTPKKTAGEKNGSSN